MGVICNGARRSGTHALVRACGLLGLRALAPGLLVKQDGDAPLVIDKLAAYSPARPLAEVMPELGDRCIRAHLPCTSAAPKLGQYDHRMLVVLRHPRNVALAVLRLLEGDVADARRFPTSAESEAIRALSSREDRLRYIIVTWRGRPLPGELRRIWRWIDEPDVAAVRFEDLMGNPHPALCALAAFLDRPEPTAAIAAQLPVVDGVDYRARQSDWRTAWTPAVDEAWAAVGGHELEAEFGYGPPADHGPQRRRSRKDLRAAVLAKFPDNAARIP